MAKEMWTLESFLEDKNLSDTFEYVICKAITGDGSDNIPGSCKGVGGTNATNLLNVSMLYAPKNPNKNPTRANNKIVKLECKRNFPKSCFFNALFALSGAPARTV